MVIDSWLWALEPTHFRVLFAILAMAEPVAARHRSPVWGEIDVPAGGLVTSLDRLAERAGVSRAVVRGALTRLQAGPLRDGREPAITVAANPRGYTLITVGSTVIGTAASTPPAQPIGNIGAGLHGTAATVHHNYQHSDQHSQIGISTATSTVPVGETSSSRNDLPVSTDAHQHSDQHTASPASQPKIAGTDTALSDQRSGDLLVDQENHTVPDSETAADKVRKKVARIPERAWSGADYLRSRVLEHDPDNIVRKQRWGPDVTTGWRFAWADEIRLMVERDGRTYEDIGRAIQWLFGGQTAEPKYRIIVLSAAALRQKWEQIKTARQRQIEQAAQPPRPAHNAQPTAYVKPPERKKWT